MSTTPNNQADAHLSTDQLRQYGAGGGSMRALDVGQAGAPSRYASTEAHLASCRSCRSELDFLALVDKAATRSRSPSSHPSDEAMLGYVEGSVNVVQKDEVSGHVTHCGACADRLAGLWQVVRLGQQEAACCDYVFPEGHQSTDLLMHSVRKQLEEPVVPLDEVKAVEAQVDQTQKRRAGFPRLAWAGFALAVGIAVIAFAHWHNPHSQTAHHIALPVKQAPWTPNRPRTVNVFKSPAPSTQR